MPMFCSLSYTILTVFSVETGGREFPFYGETRCTSYLQNKPILMEKKIGNSYVGFEIGSTLYSGLVYLDICALKPILDLTEFQLQCSFWLFPNKEKLQIFRSLMINGKVWMRYVTSILGRCSQGVLLIVWWKACPLSHLNLFMKATSFPDSVWDLECRTWLLDAA